MRIALSIQVDNTFVPFAHQHLLVGTLHKWLGENELHGQSSAFCFSRLHGGEPDLEQHGLRFSDRADMFISANEPAWIKRILAGIRQSPEMFQGLCVREIVLMEEPNLSNREIFYPASPILLKHWRGDNNRSHEHIVYTHEEANTLLTLSLHKKLAAVGLSDETARATFAPEEGRAKVMLVDYRGIKNRVSWCPIRLTGTDATKLFVWNAGIGQSTGIGFGAIK